MASLPTRTRLSWVLGSVTRAMGIRRMPVRSLYPAFEMTFISSVAIIRRADLTSSEASRILAPRLHGSLRGDISSVASLWTKAGLAPRYLATMRLASVIPGAVR